MRILLSVLGLISSAVHGQTIFSDIPRTNAVISTNLFLISLPVAGGTRTIYFSDILADIRTNLGAASATSLTLSPNGLLNIVWTNLATTPLAGLTLSNATLATAGVTVQVSPAFTWQGNVWLTGSASNAVTIFRSYVVPTTDVSSPGTTTALKIDSSMNGGAYGGVLTYDSAGRLTLANDISTSGLIQAGAGQRFIFLGRSRIESSANGSVEFKNNAGSAISTFQANIPQTTKTANWTNSAALDSGMRFANIGAVIPITNFLQTAVANQRHSYVVDAAQILSIKAAAGDVIHNAGTPTSSGGDIWSGTQWSTLTIFCVRAGHWVVEAITGTWASN